MGFSDSQTLDLNSLRIAQKQAAKLKNNSKEISKNNKNNYSGTIDFKPFYFSAKFDYEGLSSKNLFNDNSIFIYLILFQHVILT